MYRFAAISIIFTILAFSYVANPKAESFLPACLKNPEEHDYRATLERYRKDDRAFVTKRLNHETIMKMIAHWKNSEEHGDLKLQDWPLMQIVVTPHLAFLVRGKQVGDYTPICFVLHLTDAETKEIIGQTPGEVFNQETDI